MQDLKSSILAAALLLVATPLSAAPTFDLTGFSTGVTSPSVTADGITLTFADPSPSGSFFADFEGIGFLEGDLGAGQTTSFSFSFDADVVLKSYSVGFIQSLDGNESLTFSGPSGSSVENAPFALGVRNFSNMLTFLAGQTVSVSASGVDSTELIQFSSLTVDRAVVPLPASGLLLAGALAGLVAVRRRRRLH